jgi:hypothetical protein
MRSRVRAGNVQEIDRPSRDLGRHHRIICRREAI